MSHQTSNAYQAGCTDKFSIPIGTKTNLKITACAQMLLYKAGNQEDSCRLDAPLLNSQTAMPLYFSEPGPHHSSCNVKVADFQLYNLVTKAPTKTPIFPTKSPTMVPTKSPTPTLDGYRAAFVWTGCRNWLTDPNIFAFW